MTFPKMHELIPAGKKGAAEIEHFEVSQESAALSCLRRESISPGQYCCLYVDRQLMMSDGDAEHRSNIQAVHKARGDVLIAGLGIGMILIPILRKPEVTSVEEQEHARRRRVFSQERSCL